jgi:tRNA/rRNA methyltransferase
VLDRLHGAPARVRGRRALGARRGRVRRRVGAAGPRGRARVRDRDVGLSNDELARCTAAATIAANPEFGSLNLAAAVQVAAYETRVAALGDDVWSAPRFAPATGDAIAGLYAHAERTFVDMRFLHPEMPRRLMPRLKRLFARAGLEREEVNILRGILARIDQLIGRAR